MLMFCDYYLFSFLNSNFCMCYCVHVCICADQRSCVCVHVCASIGQRSAPGVFCCSSSSPYFPRHLDLSPLSRDRMASEL